ncbi:MAG: hypothetical protein OEM15_02465 [Myxococcales bacterium]|nr:hypothetical protein [Myxococcales bacterium]MDH3483947.1 hypothetical protein [Myxococcales bacterium]
MMRFVVSVLLMLGFVTFAACQKSKLQEDMMGDSTWETSGGEETPWEPAEKQPKYDEEWEEKNEPLPGEKPAPKSDLMQEFPRVTSGVIRRHELIRVLDQGLGRYLGNVEIKPEFNKGTFVGFRILKLFPGDLTYASLDLRPGDIVTSINGKPISRPEHASAIWKELRTASDLVVDYRRGSTDHTMRFVIVDQG